MGFLNGSFCFFLNYAANSEIYTLSLHDALPICHRSDEDGTAPLRAQGRHHQRRSEEHTSELQSRGHLVCRLLLEKKNVLMLVTTRLLDHVSNHFFHYYRLNVMIYCI